jgi:hypothetical protein
MQDFESCGKVDHKRQTFIVGKNRDVQVGTTQVPEWGRKTMKGRGKGSNTTGGGNIVSLGKRLSTITQVKACQDNMKK